MATMRYCPQCGTQVQVGGAFCANCGRNLRQAQDHGSGIAPASTSERQVVTTELRYRVSPNRVLLMTIISFGLYLFYWFYLTWKQYRDHTREEAFPFWHTLTLLILGRVCKL